MNNKTIICPDCGSVMTEINEYSYAHYIDEKVEGVVYHCDACDHDEVVETRWAKLSEIQRRYFHG